MCNVKPNLEEESRLSDSSGKQNTLVKYSLGEWSSDRESKRGEKKMNTLTYVLIGVVVVLVYWIVLDTKDIRKLRKQIKDREREISEKAD